MAWVKMMTRNHIIRQSKTVKKQTGDRLPKPEARKPSLKATRRSKEM